MTDNTTTKTFKAASTEPSLDIAENIREQTILARESYNRAEETKELSRSSNHSDKVNRLAQFSLEDRKGRRSIYKQIAGTTGIALKGLAATTPQSSQQSVQQIGMVIAFAGSAIGILDSVRDWTDVLEKKAELTKDDIKPSKNPNDDKANANTDSEPGSQESRDDAPRTARSPDSAGVLIASPTGGPLAPAA